MSDPNDALRHLHLRQQAPPQSTLPNIPQLPPISLASSPSIESFATALSTSSRDRENQVQSPLLQQAQRRPGIPPESTSPPSLSFTPPASPSTTFYPSQRSIRTTTSVQHLRTGVPYPSQSREMLVGAGGDHSDYSDIDGSGSRTTPVPRNRTPMPYVSASDHERRTPTGYHSSSGGGGTMSDHASGAGGPVFSGRSLSTAARTSAARLHALSTASTTSSASAGSGSSFYAGTTSGGKSPRRTDLPTQPPPSGKPLPNPTPNPGSPTASSASGSRVVNRARSASLLGMVSSVAANNTTGAREQQQQPIPRSASSVQNLQKPVSAYICIPILTTGSLYCISCSSGSRSTPPHP